MKGSIWNEKYRRRPTIRQLGAGAVTEKERLLLGSGVVSPRLPMTLFVNTSAPLRQLLTPQALTR